MARRSAPKALGALSAKSFRAAKAQQGWPGQMSFESMKMKPSFSYTARWLNGSGPR